MLFENINNRTGQTEYFFITREVKDYNVTIDGKKFFDQPVKNNLRKCDSFQKIETSRGDGYITGCFLDYNYFKDYHKATVIDLSKLKAADTDPVAMHQISFAGNLKHNASILFIIEEAK